MADSRRSHRGEYERPSLSPGPPTMSSSKRKYDDQADVKEVGGGRVSGFSDAKERPSYNNVPPPALTNIELAKQKAAEIAARLVGAGQMEMPKKARTDNGSDGLNGSSGYGYGYSSSEYPTATSSPALGFHSKRMDVPNAKVGLVIGKGGETIKQLQSQSGAKIQVTRDAEADPGALTRQVELTGTPDQVSRAEQLIREVLAEQTGSGFVPRGNIASAGGEQLQIRVPNNKVGLIIGRGGETIKNLQMTSGARIQVQSDRDIDQGAYERIVTLVGTKQQTDMASDMIREVIDESRSRGGGQGGYSQQGYRGGQQSWPPAGGSGGSGGGGYYQQQQQQQQGSYGQQQQYWDPQQQQQQPQQGNYEYYGQSEQGGNEGGWQGGYYSGYEQQQYGQQGGQEGYEGGQQGGGYEGSGGGYDQSGYYNQDGSGGYGYGYGQEQGYYGDQQHQQQEHYVAATGEYSEGGEGGGEGGGAVVVGGGGGGGGGDEEEDVKASSEVLPPPPPPPPPAQS